MYNIQKNGNFTPEAGNKQTANILYQTMSMQEFATHANSTEPQLHKKLAAIRNKLFTIRETRVHPEKDDKILTDWNGLMIAALAHAARVFDHKPYVLAAEKALHFIVHNMMQPDGTLLHRYRQKDADIHGYADDYAFLILALIELYQTILDPKYLQQALDLNQYLLNHFWDTKHGGLFFTSDTHEPLLTRTKELYDGALPSANSVTMHNLIRMARITGDTTFEEKAGGLSKAFSEQITTMPSGYTYMMNGVDFALGPSHEIVIVGDTDAQDTQNILKEIQALYLPNKVIIMKDTKHTKAIEALAPYVKDYTQIQNQATIYICKNHHCQLPTTDIEKMKQLLT
jgi:uncharacterized protein YyaL (SSP411 family)